MVEEKNDSGNIKISDEAIATIAAITAKSITGVVELDAGPVQSISDVLGVKQETRGIKINMNKETVSIDMNLVFEFGMEISEVAASVQEKVKETIENMTGLIVDRVNISVNSIKLYPSGKTDEEQRRNK